MELMEAMLLAGIVKRARAGVSEDLEHLQAMNKVRQEQGKPTVEEELQAILKAGQ